MPDEQKLLPCPFCGSDNVRHDSHSDEHWIRCEKCGACSPTMFSCEDAERTWNTRPSLPGVVTLSAEEAGRLASALKDLAMFIGHPNPDMRDKKDCQLRDKAAEALSILTRAQKEG